MKFSAEEPARSISTAILAGFMSTPSNRTTSTGGSRRMKAAKVVDPAQAGDRGRVWFGATVTLVDEDERARIGRGRTSDFR